MPTPVSSTVIVAISPEPCCGHPDGAAARGVLDRVVHQVRHGLREPGEIGVRPQRPVRQRDVQHVRLRVDRRARRLDRAGHDGSQVDALAAELDLVLRDPRHVQQIVGQPHEMQHLPLHRRAGAFDDVGVAAREAHHFDRGADRRERVAQFVRQGREEFVLAAIGVAQAHLGPLAERQIDAHADAAVDRPVRVEERLDVILHVEHGPVAADDLDLVADRSPVRDRVLHRQLRGRDVGAVALNAIRRLAGGRGQRDVAALGQVEQRRQRAVGGNVAAFRIVGDGDGHRRARNHGLERLQPLAQLVRAQIVQRFFETPVSHDAATIPAPPAIQPGGGFDSKPPQR